MKKYIIALILMILVAFSLIYVTPLNAIKADWGYGYGYQGGK